MAIEIVEMTAEDINKVCADLDEEAQAHGFKDYAEFTKEASEASKGLLKFGGSFAQALANLMGVADSKNLFKIYTAFRTEWLEHRYLFLK